MSKQKAFVKGTILGAIVGTAAGLLWAPKSGKETRDELKRQAQGLASELESKLVHLRDELSGRIDELKDVANDLTGEARIESQGLIRRAELLREDLRASATNLAKNSGRTKDEALADAKQLMSNGSRVMDELERVTKKMVASTKDKFKHTGSDTDRIL